jgi:hypothetical protein
MTQDPTKLVEPIGGTHHTDYHVIPDSFEIGPTDPRDTASTDAMGITHYHSGSRIYRAQWRTMGSDGRPWGTSSLRFGDHSNTAYLFKQSDHPSGPNDGTLYNCILVGSTLLDKSIAQLRAEGILPKE